MPEYPGQTIPTGGFTEYLTAMTPAERAANIAGAEERRATLTKAARERAGLDVEEEVFTCPYCGMEFGTAGALTMHIGRCASNPANMGEEEGEILTCPYCGMEFATADALATHIAVCPSNPANMPGGGFMPEGLGTEQYPMGGPEWMEERYGRWPGYGTALGLYGREALSPFEQYQMGQQQPLESLYDISGRMALGGYGQYAPGGMFSQWAPKFAENPFAMYGLAQGMMGDVFGMTPEQRGETGMQYGGGSLSDLLMMALRPQLGKQTAGWLTGRLPGAQQQWTREYPGWVAGAGQPSFVDYIREKYNLGQYI